MDDMEKPLAKRTIASIIFFIQFMFTQFSRLTLVLSFGRPIIFAVACK